MECFLFLVKKPCPENRTNFTLFKKGKKMLIIGAGLFSKTKGAKSPFIFKS